MPAPSGFRLTYSVVGWYSDPDRDVLAGTELFGRDGWLRPEQWRDLMVTRRWSTGGDAGLQAARDAGERWAAAHGLQVDPMLPRSIYPARSLCHGIVTDVAWLGADGPVLSGVPTANTAQTRYVRPMVAIGNSAIDALAALMVHEIGDEIDAEHRRSLFDILEAFQYGDLPLLNRPDATAQLALRIQSGWFQLTAGGTSWRLTEPDDVHDAKGRQGPPVLGDAQTALLTRLNEAQRDLDQTARQLASAQWDVFALWWKHQRLEHYVSPPPEWSSWLDAVRAGTAEARGEALALVGTYRWLRQCRDTAFLELEAVRKHLTLSSIALPSFAQPNEPVLLMTGANRAYKHGEDDAFATDGTLFCRFTGQTVAGIEVDVESQRVIVGASAMKLPQLVGPDLPPEVHDLSVEAVFLDTTEAPAIAMAADPTNPWPLLRAIRRSQTIVWNPDVHPGLVRQTIADGSGLLSLFGLGAIPSKAAVQIWSPPWSPLYLSWEITYNRATELTDDQLRCWKPPDDNRVEGVDDFTYSWRGTNPLKVVGPVTLSGKTLLTPQASDVLAARLEALIDEYADSEDVIEDLWALEDALAYVRHADLLSQSLSGLDLLLLERGQASFRTPFETTDSVVLQPYLRPDGAPWLVPDSAPLPRVPPRQFSPIRAAHVAISRLWVVDDFGQVFDVLGAMHVTPPTFEPILGPDLATPGSPRYIELKPRLAQPSACELALLGAKDDDAAVGIETAVNPVCGWLVPNRLDAQPSRLRRGGANGG